LRRAHPGHWRRGRAHHIENVFRRLVISDALSIGLDCATMGAEVAQATSAPNKRQLKAFRTGIIPSASILNENRQTRRYSFAQASPRRSHSAGSTFKLRLVFRLRPGLPARLAERLSASPILGEHAAEPDPFPTCGSHVTTVAATKTVDPTESCKSRLVPTGNG